MKYVLLFGALLVCWGCGSTAEPGLSGVQGSVKVDGEPVSAGVQIHFHLNGGDFSFATRTQDDGTYAYIPPKEAPLPKGVYQVSVTPPGAETTTDESGLTTVVGASKAKSYGKFSSPAKSGLTVTLDKELVIYDIDVDL